MMGWEYAVAACSVQGRRERLEDTYYFNSEKGLFIIADGVCRSESGAEASKLAVDTAAQTVERVQLSTDPLGLERTLQHTITVTQAAVRARFGDGLKGSTTLTLLLATNLYFVYCSVGDSRLYGVKAPRSGTSSWPKESVLTSLLFHQLTNDTNSFIGSEEAIPDSGVYPLAAKDCGFLLCTDGLYNHLQKQEWSEATQKLEPVQLGEYFGRGMWRNDSHRVSLSYQYPPQQQMEILKQQCQDAYDNVTAIYALFCHRQISL